MEKVVKISDFKRLDMVIAGINLYEYNNILSNSDLCNYGDVYQRREFKYGVSLAKKMQKRRNTNNFDEKKYGL